MRYGIPSQRPERWRLNTSWPLWGYARFLGLGGSGCIGSSVYPDSSMWARHGTLGNLAVPSTTTSGWTWSDSINRPVLALDGNDFTTVNALAGITGPVTSCCWFNYTGSTANVGRLWELQDSGSNVLSSAFVNYPGALQLTGQTYTPISALPVATASYAVGRWYNAAHVVTTTRQRVWLDGGSVGTTGVALAYPTTTRAGLGRDIATSSQYFTGRLADWMVFSGDQSWAVSQLADPVLSRDLRVGGVPLLLPVRKWWPSAAATTTSPLSAGTASCTAYGSTTATLECTAASGGTSPYTYQWYRSESSPCVPSFGTLVVGATSLTLDDTGLEPSTDYYYVCRVTDAAEDTADSNEVHVTTEAVPPEEQVAYFGYETGASDGAVGADQLDVSGPFTAPAAGVVSALEFMVAGGGHIRIGLYDGESEPTNLVDYTDPIAITSVIQWWSGEAKVGATLTAGAKYWIAILPESALTARYTTPAADLSIRYNTGASYAAGLPDPAGSLTTLGNYVRQCRVGYMSLTGATKFTYYQRMRG